MLFGNNYKKETKAFMENFKAVFDLMKSVGYRKGDVSEALYAMWLVCDYAANDSGKDRVKLGAAVINKINSDIWALDMDELAKRAEEYQTALDKNVFREEAIHPIMKDMLVINTATKIGIVLCDMLYNPACKHDYLGAEYLKYDEDQVQGFSMKVAAPIIGILDKLYKRIAE